MGTLNIVVFDMRVAKRTEVTHYRGYDKIPENINIEKYFESEGVYNYATFWQWMRKMKLNNGVEAGPYEHVYGKKNIFLLVRYDNARFEIYKTGVNAIDLKPPIPEDNIPEF